MIFQHTLDKVLSTEKTQTSRIWKDDYIFSSDEYDRELPTVVLSMKAWDAGKIRRLYQVGQVLSVQPARGAKGVAKIRIIELAKRDVRDFTAEDIQREGFPNHNAFFAVWMQMHDEITYTRTMMYFSLEQGRLLEAARKQNAEQYTALVIGFELLKD